MAHHQAPPPLTLSLAGEEVCLHAGRALGWPAGGVLFIADPHLGKAAAFRSMGVAVPEGTREDLVRLGRLLEVTGARRLVVLGDFLHARSGLTPAVLDALRGWRRGWANLQWVLVRGNHDRGAGDPPGELGIQVVEEGWPMGPFVCRHEPGVSAAGHVLAGHVHPGVVLRERGGGGLRAPCFLVGSGCSILPAFGSFTGLHPVRRRPGERVFAVGPDRVLEVGSRPPPHGEATEPDRP